MMLSVAAKRCFSRAAKVQTFSLATSEARRYLSSGKVPALLPNVQAFQDEGTGSIDSVELDQGGLRVKVAWTDGRQTDHSSIWMRHQDRGSSIINPLSGQAYIGSKRQVLRPDAVAFEAISVEQHEPWGDCIAFRTTNEESGIVPALVLKDYERITMHTTPKKRAPTEIRRFDYGSVKSGRADDVLEMFRAFLDDGACIIAGAPSRSAFVVDEFFPRVLKCFPLPTFFSPAGQSIRFERAGDSVYGDEFSWHGSKQRDETDPAWRTVYFTSERLNAHTDFGYYDSAPGAAVFHHIKAPYEGGITMLTDIYRVLEELREEDDEAFQLLVRTPVLFQNIQERPEPFGRIHYRRVAPLVQVDADGTIIDARANLPTMFFFDSGELPAFISAVRRYQNMLDSDERALRCQLETGDLLLFNHQRMAHYRTAFPPDADRTLGVTYVNAIDIRSRVINVFEKNGYIITPRLGNLL